MMRPDTYVTGFLLIIASAAAAVIGMIAVRRVIQPRLLQTCHEVGGYLFSVTGTLYAVLLGLIVVDAMNTFQEAHRTTIDEANSLSDIILLAGREPEAHRKEVMDLAMEYADLVVSTEWDAMDKGRHCPQARRAALRLFDTVCRFEPRTESEKSLYDLQVNACVQLWNNRRVRTGIASNKFHGLKWAVILGGGMITVGFTFFFVLESLRLQAAMTALVAVTISLNIYLVEMYGYPFSGDLRVDPSSYSVIRELSTTPEIKAESRETGSPPSYRQGTP